MGNDDKDPFLHDPAAFERSMVEQDASVKEVAERAGWQKPASVDPVDELERHCKAFIEGAGLTQHARMMALPKLAEMAFWIRAGYGKG